MASGPLLGGGNGNGNGNEDGAASREKHRWADTGKVYTRKSFNKSKQSQIPNSQPPPSAAADLPPPPPLPPSHASDDDSSSLNPKSNGQRCFISFSLSSKSKNEVRELRRRLTAELEQVRALSRKFEQNPTTNFDARRGLSVVVPTEVSEKEKEKEKEKRTPKANQYYRNSEFLLAKDKLPPSDSHHSHKKSKQNGNSKIGVVDSKVYSQAFKSCANLLAKIMKHKHGWVFNTPVDVKALGLHDYYTVIKHPMDLGTVKTRLSKNWYKRPEEFAEDVRLTFRNAMIYNPKGQDVHIMAEQLLQLFEEKWPSIEAEYTYLLSPKPAAPLPPVPPLPSVSAKKPPPIDMRKVLERPDSMAQPMSVNSKTSSKPLPLSYTPQIGRPSVLKKPKAKDLHKRDMTFEEKQKLSNNLQNLPPEKLDNVVQIIKKRNSMLNQHDDEIEVDIDSVDTETLWELDRFVTNYKKSLSKNKRKAELAVLARAEGHHEHAEQEQEQEQETVLEKNSDPVITEVPKESRTVVDEKGVASSPKGGEKKVDDASRSSCSSSSSSDSGSSSSGNNFIYVLFFAIYMILTAKVLLRERDLMQLNHKSINHNSDIVSKMTVWMHDGL